MYSDFFRGQTMSISSRPVINMLPWQLAYDCKLYEMPAGKNKDFVIFYSSEMIRVFFLDIFLRSFLEISGTIPDTCAVWGSAQTPAVIGQTGPCDPTADFVGCAVLLSTAIKTLLSSISHRGVAITENC